MAFQKNARFQAPGQFAAGYRVLGQGKPATGHKRKADDAPVSNA